MLTPSFLSMCIIFSCLFLLTKSSYPPIIEEILRVGIQFFSRSSQEKESKKSLGDLIGSENMFHNSVCVNPQECKNT